MKAIYILLLCAITIFFSGCEEVIDLKLNDSKPVVVIEANVTDEMKPQVVTVSQTKPFTNNNSVNPVSDAMITLKDLSDNKTYNFGGADESGKYLSENFRGKPGNTYELSVASGNKVYKAISTMPKKVLLDSISITEISFFGQTQKYIKVNFSDPAQFENQYRYVLTVNNKPVEGYFVDSDRFNNGKYISNTIFSGDPELKSGDEIKVEFQGIDMTIYRYFFAISQISGNGGPPTAPSNPDSSFNNGALGYFSAHTKEVKNATIK